MFLLPLRDCPQAVSQEQRSAGRLGHPGRDAHPLLGRGGEDLLVNTGVNGYR